MDFQDQICEWLRQNNIVPDEVRSFIISGDTIHAEQFLLDETGHRHVVPNTNEVATKIVEYPLLVDFSIHA